LDRFWSNQDSKYLRKAHLWTRSRSKVVPEMCDITIQDELENVLAWSSVNKLQLNLTKTKEIVFRRASVNFDVLPQHLSNVERLECVRLLGIYVDSKLSFFGTS